MNQLYRLQDVTRHRRLKVTRHQRAKPRACASRTAPLASYSRAVAADNDLFDILLFLDNKSNLVFVIYAKRLINEQ